jgi:hypothetical protein
VAVGRHVLPTWLPTETRKPRICRAFGVPLPGFEHRLPPRCRARTATARSVFRSEPLGAAQSGGAFDDFLTIRPPSASVKRTGSLSSTTSRMSSPAPSVQGGRNPPTPLIGSPLHHTRRKAPGSSTGSRLSCLSSRLRRSIRSPFLGLPMRVLPVSASLPRRRMSRSHGRVRLGGCTRRRLCVHGLAGPG